MVVPVLVRSVVDGRATLSLGDALLDEYVEFVGARASVNTMLATAFDLKVFFTIVAKAPSEVTTRDVFEFLRVQRLPRRGGNVVRTDGEHGVAARTIARRLSTVRGLFNYLIVRGDALVVRNPVPSGLAARRPGGQRSTRGIPLIRTPRTMPRVLSPNEADGLLAALRRDRDRAMFEAMLLGRLRRCEVLGLRLGDVHLAERRLFIAEGKGGRQRIVPVAHRFFDSLARYLERERPRVDGVDQVFVVLKGPRRGLPLSAAGLDEILQGARQRAGLERGTCHQLRHTCFTPLREAGMALEAIQACNRQPRILLHLSLERRTCHSPGEPAVSGTGWLSHATE